MPTYRVPNPFIGHDEYHCFGCDPDNTAGLGLEFTREDDRVVSTWAPKPEHEGYPGVIHGGILSTVADEIGGWFTLAVLEKAGVTRELTSRYLHPARAEDGPFTVTAFAEEVTKKLARIGVEITNRDGVLCTKSRADYALFSEAVARKRLSYPGPEAFRPGTA